MGAVFTRPFLKRVSTKLLTNFCLILERTVGISGIFENRKIILLEHSCLVHVWWGSHLSHCILAILFWLALNSASFSSFVPSSAKDNRRVQDHLSAIILLSVLWFICRQRKSGDWWWKFRAGTWFNYPFKFMIDLFSFFLPFDVKMSFPIKHNPVKWK